ncbi:VPLPA-CTERM sorting domain-containing protein [Pseudodesulfovibrio portus]|uniref:Uncharacterized protein n=1 Tax=Pseudodesulfovibrio portus TaxID=231439 RepID=A0ABM8AQI0_9BACT|nr:VPLPA-CTERM sorting domain-containing protein [Pseudodesulfovibrio portus]BDQ33671.1 hypothetical protein JCM14722_12130 [Pseudodesulfovibrio portus]
MKSFKTIFMGAIIAGMLLVAANSAMAAYTGLYENENDSSLFVNLGTGYFDVNGIDHYDVTYVNPEQTLWYAEKNSGGYIYGASQGSRFAFIQSGTLLDPSLFDGLAAKIDGFVTAVETNSIINSTSPLITNEVKFAVLVGLAGSYFGDLSVPILTSDWFGFGEFAADGSSFDVTVGDLSLEGLQAMLCDDCTETYRATPIPGAVWLLGSGLVGLVGLRRRMRG